VADHVGPVGHILNRGEVVDVAEFERISFQFAFDVLDQQFVNPADAVRKQTRSTKLAIDESELS
tara:strand:+ start:3074 stop:3265 length:192 start_codon:yes stop_codon:yes gene_type:complete